MFPNTHRLIYGFYGTSEWEGSKLQDIEESIILLPEDLHEKLHGPDGCLPLKTLPLDCIRWLEEAVKAFEINSPRDFLMSLIKVLYWFPKCHAYATAPEDIESCKDNAIAINYQRVWLEHHAPHCLDAAPAPLMTVSAH